MTGDNKHSVFKIAANLAAACLVSGIVIGAVYYVTAPSSGPKGGNYATRIHEGFSKGC